MSSWIQKGMATAVMALTLLLGACTGIPERVEPVRPFELSGYLGAWYEVARLDHSFERGLTQVTATYSLRDDGGVKVINRGFDAAKNEWREAEGKAYFVDDPQTGYLKVSFFGPFYGSYIVAELLKDANGQANISLVSGPDTSYLWILARTPNPAAEQIRQLVNKASELGFDTHKLIWIDPANQPADL